MKVARHADTPDLQAELGHPTDVNSVISLAPAPSRQRRQGLSTTDQVPWSRARPLDLVAATMELNRWRVWAPETLNGVD